MASSKKVRVKAKAPGKAEPKPAPSAGDAANLLADLNKTLGDGTAMTLADGGMDIKIRGVISTRCFKIDEAIGRGGIPRGRLTILHGGEGGGKTTLLLQTMAEVQAMGGMAVYIDAEYKLDPEYAASLGVDMKRLIYVQPESLEDAMEAINKVVAFAKAKRAELGRTYPVLIALDSMNSATPRQVLNGEIGDHHMAPHSRVYSAELPKIIKAISKEDIALVLVSQLRKKIGVMFGDDSEIAGGNSPKHHASVILFVSRIGKIKDAKLGKGKDQTGNRCQVNVKKNQIAPPFRKADFTISFGKGIDSEVSLIEAGEERGLVTTSGSWYSLGEERIGQGIEKAAQWLRDNTKQRDALEAKLRKEMGW